MNETPRRPEVVVQVLPQHFEAAQKLIQAAINVYLEHAGEEEVNEECALEGCRHMGHLYRAVDELLEMESFFEFGEIIRDLEP